MNRKTKAIIQAAVAMGYGTEADYSGASVGATLEEFAAIAAEGGGVSGGGVIAEIKDEGINPLCSMSKDDIAKALSAGTPIVFHLKTANQLRGQTACVYAHMPTGSIAAYNVVFFNVQSDTIMSVVVYRIANDGVTKISKTVAFE
jgi:hypothetical protein